MNEKSTQLAQIGCGYWGPNLLRNFSSLPDCSVKYVVDSSAERRTYVQRSFPKTEAITSLNVALDDPEVNGVIIATPAGSHFELARAALHAGKHVFVEKPLATKVAEVDVLAAEARTGGLVVMVGHTFLYNSAVRYVKKLIDCGDLGKCVTSTVNDSILDASGRTSTPSGISRRMILVSSSTGWATRSQ